MEGNKKYSVSNFNGKMKKGEKGFFHPSKCKTPGIVGPNEVIDLNIVEPTQFDQDSKYFDPKSKPDNPRWDCVKVKYISKSNKILSLPELKILFNEEELLVVKKGNRLSILPVRKDIAKILLEKI